MDIEALRIYCLSRHQGVTEEFPFDEVTLVFKIGGKMFALLPLNHIPTRINLKCDPERAIELREKYPFIVSGFHMHKKHWNSVIVENDTDEKLLKELVDHSFSLVYDALPKKIKAEL